MTKSHLTGSYGSSFKYKYTYLTLFIRSRLKLWLLKRPSGMEWAFVQLLKRTYSRLRFPTTPAEFSFLSKQIPDILSWKQSLIKDVVAFC